jgi:thioredoxin 1
MKKIAIELYLLGVLFVSACNQNVNAQSNESATISAVEMSKQIQNKKPIQLIDVRTAEEFADGHIKNAENIDINSPDFSKQLALLDKEKPIYVYCLSGGRSTKAAGKLKELGFAKVYNMQEGMMKWRAAKLPEIKGNNTALGMTKQEYEKLISETPVLLVDFYANWCEPCKKMKPYLDEIDQTMKEKVKVIRINVDKNQALVKNLGVDALPVLMLYKDNKMVWKQNGFTPKEKVLEELNK